jgi:antitoxin MazE
MNDDFNTSVNEVARVFKLGNSLAIRIPSAVANEIALEDGAVVEIAADHGTIYVRKAPSRALAGLVARITTQNLQRPTFDQATGTEDS